MIFVVVVFFFNLIVGKMHACEVRHVEELKRLDQPSNKQSVFLQN